MVDDFGTPEQAAHFCTYHDGQWTTSDPFDNFILTSIVFRDTLYVGGVFTSVNGIPINYIARKVNGQWSTAGTFDNVVNRLKELDGELYAIGDFSFADGQLCQGLAKRVGSGWQTVVPLGCDNCSVKDAVIFNGELVASGSITFTGNPYRHVIRLHDGAWQPVGEQGIYGSLSGGGPLAVYQGHLYLGGLIDINAGNAGHAIMRWNGNEWSSVGTGVQDESGGYSQLIRVDDLNVHGGLLFASGGFTYAGNVPSNRIATWNGIEWCSVGGSFGDWAVNSIAFLSDTLFAACWDQADSQSVNHLAKFIAPAYEGNCSVPMALKPAFSSQVELVSLGGGSYSLHGHSGFAIAKLYNTIGQVTGSWAIRGETPFDLPLATTGAHVLWIEGLGARKLLVQP